MATKAKQQKNVGVEYVLVRSQSQKALEDEVVRYLRKGFKLAGGVQLLMPEFDSNGANIEQRVCEFIQAVYKTD